jgi:tryptophanyl-tRNA synthetase
MAADILAYKATHVPVGEDQKQHLELSRNIAQKFNEDFQAPDFFPLPEPLIGGTGARVMSLRDGTQKMSKSDPSAFSRIELFDEPDIILQKIRKARTDAEPLPEAAEDLEPRAEARNLVGIFAAIRRITNQDVLAKWAGKGFAEFKPALAEVIIDEIGPLKAKAEGYLADRASLDAALTSGADKARARAADIVAEAKRLVGFGIRA